MAHSGRPWYYWFAIALVTLAVVTAYRIWFLIQAGIAMGQLRPD